jgi:hypothetical protein
MPKIPGSRGNIQAPGGQNVASNISALQEQLVPGQRGWYLSTVPLSAGGTASAALSAADTLFFYYVGTVAEYTKLQYARIGVGVAAAKPDSVACTAIYYLDEKANRLIQIPNSLAKFSLASTGIKSTKLLNVCELRPDQHLFIGLVSDVAAELGGFAAASYKPFYILRYNFTVDITDIPKQIDIIKCTKAALRIVNIVYLSEQANKVI